MNTKRRRLFALLLGLVLVLSFVMLAACDNGEEEEPQGPVYTIGLSAQVLELERYGRGELTATVYKDGVATTDSVTWSSANTAVATVSGGVVVAVGEGSAQITAAAQGQTAACTVTVTDEGIVPQLVVADTTIPLTYRADDPGYYDILAEVKFYDYDTSDAVISYEAVTSDTSDPSVIELSPEGRVTAKKMGRATVLVSATWNGYTCTEVPVSVVVYDDIEVRLLDEEDVALTPGETSALYTWAGTVEGNTFTKSETFGAKVLKKTEEVADATVEWQTSDAAVAEVKDGVVTAKAEGTAEIWCEYTEGDFVYESLRRTVTVSYPWVDLTESAAAEYLVANQNAADVLKEYVSDTTHTTDAVYIEDGDENILSAGKIDIATLAGGANVLLFKDNDAYGYILSVTVVTKTIGDASEFKAWREANHGDNNTGFYAYGKGEYVLLRTDITIDEANWGAYRNAAYSGYLDGKEVGFLGTFDGGGNTITVQSAGTGGLFGDLGNGSVIKNLGVVAQLTSTGGSRPAALAALAEGATIDNCYIQAKTGGENSYGGVVIAGVASVTMTNCVIDSTPGNDANSAWSAVFTSYVRRGWEENLKFENVVGISRTAGNTVFARVMNDAGNAYTDQNTGVTVVDGSAAGFDIETHKLADFDASGFNSECFFVEEGYIPLWHAQATDIQPELAFNESSVDITTDKDADNNSAQLKYSFTYRGSAITPDKVEWEVTEGIAYASVSDGVVTGTDMGTAEVTLTVTYNEQEYTATITVNVTIPTEDVTPKQEMLFDKSTDTAFDATALAEAIWGADSGKTITDLRYGSAAASASVVNADTYDWASVPAGEERVFYVVTENVAYKFTALVVSRRIGSAQEFMDWREETSKDAKSYNNADAAKANAVYYYGEGEYILLTNSFTINEVLNHQVWLQTAPSTIPADGKVGFLGTFNGNGHTITATIGQSGLFGDLGSGAVIKNLGVVATLNYADVYSVANDGNIQSHPAALACRAYGATIENCYISVKDGCEQALRRTGVFMTAGNVTIKNSVIVSDSQADNGAVLTEYVHTGYTITCENVVGVSYNAAIQVFARYEGSAECAAGVTLVDGSAAGFDIAAYELTGFDASGFNTEYFFVEGNYIPQWGKTAADFKPVAAITENSVEVTTETGTDGNTAQLSYTFTYRGTPITEGVTVAWSVTNGDTFASVSNTGLVTGRAEGTAKITLTVTYDQNTYTDTVTVIVTMPVKDAALAEDVVFLKSVTDLASSLIAENVWGAGTDKTIADIRYGSAAASASILSEGTLDWTGVSLGENEFYVIGSDNVAYRFTGMLVTKTIGSAEEFMAWRNANAWSGQSEGGTRVKYTYGKDEYILLTNSFTIEEELMQRVYLEGSFNTVYTDIGFLGVFDGNGYTITAEKAALSGLFGDIGSGAVIKNLGVVATLSDTKAATNIGVQSVRPAALANRAFGVTLQNCYFDVTCGTNVNHSGLLFATAANIKFENCVIVGTPGNGTAAGTSALVTSFVPINHYNSISFENTVLISRNANNQAIAFNGNNSAFTADVTVINGSAADFDITTYELTDFDASGFNTEYFTVEENRIPQWKGAQA